MQKIKYIGDYGIIFVTKRLKLNLKKDDTFEVSEDEYMEIFEKNKNFKLVKEEIKKEEPKKEEVK